MLTRKTMIYKIKCICSRKILLTKLTVMKKEVKEFKAHISRLEEEGGNKSHTKERQFEEMKKELGKVKNDSYKMSNKIAATNVEVKVLKEKQERLEETLKRVRSERNQLKKEVDCSAKIVEGFEIAREALDRKLDDAELQLKDFVKDSSEIVPQDLENDSDLSKSFIEASGDEEFNEDNTRHELSDEQNSSEEDEDESNDDTKSVESNATSDNNKECKVKQILISKPHPAKQYHLIPNINIISVT